MNSSDELDKLAPALVKAQAALPSVVKDGVNPHFKSRFATLGAITDAALPALNANGFALVQGGGYCSDDAGLEVATRLLHDSGQWLESSVRVPMVKPDPQAMGSAITYARRYLLAAMLGIVADDDDDAEAATHRTPEAPAFKRPAMAPSSPAGASKPAKAPSGGVPKSCPNCGGKIWNNLEKKASGQFKASSPDWSCADAECKKRPGSVGWPEKDAKEEFSELPPALAAPLPTETDWDE